MDLFLPLAIQLLARRIVRLFRLKWVRELLHFIENFMKAVATLCGGVFIFASIGYVPSGL